MLNACANAYSWSKHPFKRAGCIAAAEFYTAVVSGPAGWVAFREANDYNPSVAATNRENTGRCMCVCGDPYHSYCNGQCFINYLSDNNNCGSCGARCVNNNVCGNGRCYCPFNTQTDNNNCGACGVRCVNGNVCGNGRCYCPFDTQTDNNNCGACGLKCPSYMKCQNGKCVCKDDTCGNSCVTLQSNPRNCGTCGHVCASGYCFEGQCVTPTVSAGQCWPGNVISNGGFGE